MAEQHPYQLVAFLGNEPAVNEPVYGGLSGWYAQIALKRRFGINEMSEKQLIAFTEEFCQRTLPFEIHIGSYSKPERMPGGILEVAQTTNLLQFHQNYISLLGKHLISRYPERDGQNYLPHITVEYDGKLVVDVDRYQNRYYVIGKVWLLKDVGSEDSLAFKPFKLGK